ncbi:hypothetical protein ACMGE9_09900 [Macrococcus sp. EM39E]|uniref:hypothetical protein n=1 Tax=Macrococcus animalis TaxID=3395467 RepID=UPI0039BE4EFD
MDFELEQIHNVLVTVKNNPDTDYYDYFRDDDIIYILLDMGLVEFKFKGLLDEDVFEPDLKIEVTKKGLLYMTAYMNQLNY